jgi:predicted metal-binding protein
MRTLTVCTTCRFSPESKLAPDGRTGGETLLGHAREALGGSGYTDIAVRGQPCLWNCTRPCSVILQDDQRFSYVTGGHEPTREQADAIVAWFDLHGKSATGEVPFKDWPGRIRGHFIARIPAQGAG